jgi:TRAP-type C4-dicarboxylate transport system permease small subunit
MIALIDRIATLAARAALWLGAILLLLMAFHITTDVAMRNLFGKPIAGTLEFGTYYYMVAASFLALGYAQLHDRNISVDILVFSAPARIRMFVEFVALIITLIYAVAFTYASLIVALEKTRKGEFALTQYFNLATWPSRWILVVSGAIFGLVLLAQILRLASALYKGEDRRIAGLVGNRQGSV